MAMPARQCDEVAVIEAVQQGDQQALGELIERHGRWVRGLVYAQLGDVAATDDVLQQVWLRVWQQARSLRDPRTWRAWLCRLARNAAYDERRRRRRREAVETSDAGTAGNRDSATEVPAAMEAAERQRTVLRALRGLPTIYREPMVLRHLEGWSYQQIAEVLDLPAATIETRLVRARRLLREALAGKV